MAVIYQSHVQDIGWMQFVNDNEISGITGRGLKVEAVRFDLKNTNINIKYKTHIQDYGWESEWKIMENNLEQLDKIKKIEAIRIKLNTLDDYSVMYRAYLEGQGWQEWKKDGEMAGTTGENRKLEAIQVKIVPLENKSECSVRYTTHIQDIGWIDYEKDGNTSGVINKEKKIEGIKIVGKKFTRRY